MIKVTKSAADKFKTIVNERSLPNTTALRVDLQQTGNNPESVRLVLGLEPEEPHKDHQVSTTDNARLVVGEPVAEALGNGEVDYRQEEESFVFQRVPQNA